MSTLVNTFSAGYSEPEALETVDDNALETALRGAFDEAAKAWPTVTMSAASFVEYIAQRMPASPDILSTLEKLHTNDLYLVAACVDGDQSAISGFTVAFRTAVLRSAERVERQGVQADDTCQQLMEHLLLPRGDRPPALALYCGQGPLIAYVRVASLRRALRILERYKKTPTVDNLEHVMQLADTSDNPELATLKDKYRAEFKTAFQWSLGQLHSADRNLLRYHYLTELNTRQIGKLLGLNQSSVVRRLARVRAELLAQTRTRLMDELGMGQSSFDSIMMLVQSQLDVSIERMLHTRKD